MKTFCPRATPNRALALLGLMGLCAVLGACTAARPKAAQAQRPDPLAAILALPDRSKDDRERDAIDHPGDVLRLAGLKPGMKVADILAADGYYSELASRLVGPQGHVLLLNNAAYEKWSQGAWAQRLKHCPCANIEHRLAELEQMQLGEQSLDAVLLIKVYHDFYWVQPNSTWPPVNVPVVLEQIRRALKPGGILVLVDHSANAGHGAADAGSIHRIDEAYARKEFEALGFSVIGTSDVLRHPEDQRELITFKGPMVGKTDRFVMILQKAGQRR